MINDLITKVTIPTGIRNDYEIKRKYIEPRNVRPPFIPPGEYTFLYKNKILLMSDTPAEQNDHIDPVLKAKGHCLIVGLGIGMVLNAIAKKPEVKHIDIVEISEDVISLVLPYYQKLYPNKITIYNDDIFKWKPKKNVYYDMIWFDIWSNICTDNLKEMETLHRKFGKKGKWKGSWKKEYLQYRKRKENNFYY